MAKVKIHETSLSGDCRHSTHAVLLRSNPPLPAASIRNHQHIATMIIDRGFILTPVLVELVIARQGFARGLGITRFWAILGPILQIPADRQFTPAAPDCARHWATASTRLHSSFSHSNSLLPCLSGLFPSFSGGNSIKFFIATIVLVMCLNIVFYQATVDPLIINH